MVFDIKYLIKNDVKGMPDVIYIDANPIIDMAQGNKIGTITKDFLEKYYKDPNNIAIWSKYTYKEVHKFFHIDEYMRFAKHKGIIDEHGETSWKVAENVATLTERQRLNQTVDDRVGDIFQSLRRYGYKETLDEEIVEELAHACYREYGGNMADAEHLAFSNQVEVNSVLTNDAGFIRYPWLNLFCANNAVIGQAVPNQPLVGYVDLAGIFGIQLPSPTLATGQGGK
jgi:hypothetical protein